MNSLETLWASLSPDAEDSSFVRVDEVHPLDLYVGLDSGGARVFLLVTDHEIAGAETMLRGFETHVRRRTDGRWALTVRLRLAELSRLFAHLCQDLVDSSRHRPTADDAVRFVIERLKRWERLLSRDRHGILAEAAFRGLVGELAVLHSQVLPRLGARAAIEAWVGPLEADQDFQLADRVIEVKTTSPGSLTVTISSAEQLDVFGLPLLLAVVPIATGADRTPSVTTLPDLIADISRSLVGHPEAQILFDERLQLYGYEPRVEYVDRSFSLGEIRAFSVTERFPKILRSEISTSISRVKYTVELGACRDFEVNNLFG